MIARKKDLIIIITTEANMRKFLADFSRGFPHAKKPHFS